MIELVYETDDGAEASIMFDAGVSEEHVADAMVPIHPVDSGAEITDHVRAKLRELRLEVHVTNTPIRQPTSLAGGAVLNLSNQQIAVVEATRVSLGAGVDESATFLPPGARAAQELVEPAVVTTDRSRVALRTQKFDRGFDRVRQVFEELLRHRERGTLFRVVTVLDEYEDMIIRNLSAPHSADDGDAVTISLGMRETRVAETVLLANAPDPAVRAGQPTKDRGRKPANEPDEEQKKKDEEKVEENESWAYGLLGLGD